MCTHHNNPKAWLVIIVAGLFVSAATITPVIPAYQISTPTLDVPARNATMEAIDQKTRAAAPLIPTSAYWTNTPGSPPPTRTPYYSYCQPVNLGGGLLFERCIVDFLFPRPKGLGKYWVNNLWSRKTSNGTSDFYLDVYAGDGGLTVYTTDSEEPTYYPISNNISVKIVDVQGSVLVLGSLSITPSQQLYFDVNQRQFVPSLSTLTPTPTLTFTSTSTHTPTPTSTRTPTRTLTPTPNPSQYPVTIQGLRAMLRDLHDRNQVEDGIYRALDVILISAARQVAHDNEFVAIVELRAFVKIVEVQSGKQIKPEAAEQLTTQAHKVRQRLWEEVDRYRDD